MRTFEIILIIVNFAVVLSWLIPARYRRRSLSVILSALGLFILVFQITSEGDRWQMVMGYALTVLGAAVSFWAVRPQALEVPQRHFRKVRISFGIVGLLLLGLTIALGTLFPIPRLPLLTGPYPVGTTVYHFVDATREEIYTSVPSDVREIMVQFWYPAAPQKDAQPGPLMAEVNTSGPVIARRIGLPPFLISHLRLVRTNSFVDAPLAGSVSGYPVLLFSHGWGGVRAQNTTQMEELASHGYVVAALDHTYGAAVTVFPGGRVALWNQEILPFGASTEAFDQASNRLVGTWSDDLRFVLDQVEAFNAGELPSPFFGQLDLEAVGVLGHSTGGGTTVEMCAKDERCKAGLAMDAWLEPVSSSVIATGLAQPFMFMLSEGWSQGGVSDRNGRLQEEVLAGLTDDGYLLTIAGTKHFDFSSFPLLSPLTSVIGLKGPIDGNRVVEIVNTYSLAYFNRYLKGQNSSFLAGPSDAYPEVKFWVNNPN
jgi:predicted dienelactone hydrolase